jgi:hypothetical protein
MKVVAFIFLLIGLIVFGLLVYLAAKEDKGQ